MKSSKQLNAEIDAAVFAAIKSGCIKSSSVIGAIRPEQLRPNRIFDSNDEMRVVDKSLQRLRRKGMIRFHSPGGWKVHHANP